MSTTFQEAQRMNRKPRRSSAIAVTTETQQLLECIQFTVQVNEGIAQLHDLLTQLGSAKDNPQVRKDLSKVIRHCLDVAKNAKDRFLYIVLNCKENVKLQNQAGQQLGIFGFCLTYMQGELQKGLKLITNFPLNDESLTQHSLHTDMEELDEILQSVEKHVHYIRPTSDADTPELFRSKSDRATSSRIAETPDGTAPVMTPHLSSSNTTPANYPFCTGLLCMPKKYV